MSTATKVAPKPSEPAVGVVAKWKDSTMLSVVVPYAICVAVQLPLLLLYYSKMWKMHPHYQFFPFAVIATAAGIYLRWPNKERQPFRASTASNVFFVLGVIFGICGALFIFDWFAAASVYSFVVSFCARTKDGETGRSMLPVSFPLLTSLSLPLDRDVWIITWLQTLSSHAASNVLDLLGYLHYLAGNVLQFPDHEYFVEEACSGIMSFFLLLFLTTVYVVWMHRPWFRSVLLVLSGLFWAYLMNTLRILVIPIAQATFNLDLSSGVSHDMLGYFCVILAILLVVSTDQFLSFVFGPVDPNTFESSSQFVRRINRFWNRVFSGTAQSSGETRRRHNAIGFGSLGMIAVGAVVMVFVGAVSMDGAFRSLRSGIGIQFFDNYHVTHMEATDLPRVLGLKAGDTEASPKGIWMADDSGKGFYSFRDRTRGSDLGIRSDVWSYNINQTPYLCIVALDQPFPGWHELTRCYTSEGWKIVPDSRIRKERKLEETSQNDEIWPFVQVQFDNALGQHGFLLFSFFDAFGDPFNAPTDWADFNSFLERVRNRLNNRIRARLFKSESYQVQAFVQSHVPLTDDEKQQVIDNYLIAREALRQGFLNHRQGKSTPGAGESTQTSGSQTEPTASEKTSKSE